MLYVTSGRKGHTHQDSLPDWCKTNVLRTLGLSISSLWAFMYYTAVIEQKSCICMRICAYMCVCVRICACVCVENRLEVNTQLRLFNCSMSVLSQTGTFAGILYNFQKIWVNTDSSTVMLFSMLLEHMHIENRYNMFNRFVTCILYKDSELQDVINS